jgi:hypothetical protein
VDFRKPHPSEWRRHPNQNMIAVDDRDWPAVRLLSDCFKSRLRLEAEILVLRHQLSVLQQRAPRRVHLRWVDRALFIWLYRRCPRILDAVTIVRPETVVRVASNGLRRLLALEASFAWGPTPDRQRGTRSHPKNEF